MRGEALASVEFGVPLPQLDGVAEAARAAEAQGYDFVAAGEHLFFTGPVGNSLVSLDPGVVSRVNPVELDPAGLLPPLAGQPLHFNVLAAPSGLTELGGRNLSFWDGMGTVTWSAVPDTETLSIIKGETSVQEAARKHGLKVSEVEDWKEKLLLGAENALRSKPKDDEALKDEQYTQSFCRYTRCQSVQN